MQIFHFLRIALHQEKNDASEGNVEKLETEESTDQRASPIERRSRATARVS